ncbi:Fis family transcriptional regulator [Aliiglaciecola sp. CAU 1673]|uniref:Fis family transcriptional regulator n=1 Tax=Aliiglaciecola sp. CAU 1673 TaxID=3032595 RepID=UPI0023DA6887|nr:Fis family transcriptional regulator [Aliiglaciecola sp. CAU 1673]MDF2176912.1 Fis family transcriptional regulator [Aliiglaciecola sp. CAU 1673]
MNKTIKKLDDNVVKALTLACEAAKGYAPGFTWLTHTASYERFPGSLVVTCVFDTQAQLQEAIEEGLDKKLRQEIQGRLLRAGIRLKDARQNVRLDSEEACAAMDGGNWIKRLKRFEG